jgi:hypothetical protein
MAEAIRLYAPFLLRIGHIKMQGMAVCIFYEASLFTLCNFELTSASLLRSQLPTPVLSESPQAKNLAPLRRNRVKTSCVIKIYRPPYPAFLLYWICLGFFVGECRSNKAFEKRMCFIWSGLEFRMCLSSDEPRMIRNLDHLNDMTVRRETNQFHTIIC